MKVQKMVEQRACLTLLVCFATRVISSRLTRFLGQMEVMKVQKNGAAEGAPHTYITVCNISYIIY